MDLLSYLRILKRHWVLILALCVAGGVLGAASAKLHGTTTTGRTYYKATTTLVVDFTQHNGATPAFTSLDQLAIFTTTGDVPDAVAKKVGEGSDGRQLAERITTLTNTSTSTIAITAIAADPQTARTLADAFEGADVFFGLSVANCVTKEMVKKMSSAPIIFALSNPDPGHDDQSIQTARSGESPGNQPVEAAQGNLPKSGSANLVTTDDSTADGAAHRGDDISASFVDPNLSGNRTKLLLPQAAGLIANAVPFDPAALEKAVDQFFDQLESLGMGQLVEQGPIRVIPLSLALLSTVTAVEVARRRLKSRTGERKTTERQNPLGSEELLGFPELPGSWSTNLT